MNEQKTKKIKPTYAHIFFYCFFLFFSIATASRLPSSVIHYNKVNSSNFVQVYATITDYKKWSRENRVWYGTYYEYVDKNNVKYTGFWRGDYRVEEEAKSMIGKHVPIYVDVQAQFHVRDLDNTSRLFGIIMYAGLSSITFVLMLNSAIRLIRYKRKHLIWMGLYFAVILAMGIWMFIGS